jgi:hypothetical protein
MLRPSSLYTREACLRGFLRGLTRVAMVPVNGLRLPRCLVPERVDGCCACILRGGVPRGYRRGVPGCRSRDPATLEYPPKGPLADVGTSRTLAITAAQSEFDI